MPDGSSPTHPDPEPDPGTPADTESTSKAGDGQDSNASGEVPKVPAQTAASDEATTDSARDYRTLVIVQIGHEDDPDALIDKVADAERLLDAGDFQSAGAAFREVLAATPSAEMRRFVEERLRRLKPDRVALAVAAICIVALVVIWILATRAG